MKKILLVATTLLISVSVAFAAVGSGIDLQDLFTANQVGLGYRADEFDAGLYGHFGTDKLRFGANIIDLGGFVNNGQEATGTTMPVTAGHIPAFFVAVGYNLGANRIGVGYGLAKTWDSKDNYSKPGWMGNDISVFWQGSFGANTFKFASPIQIGVGTGKKVYDYTTGSGLTVYDKDGVDTGSHFKGKVSYDAKDTTAFSIAPEIRWQGKLGPLAQVRLEVPFGTATTKEKRLSGKELDAINTEMGLATAGYNDDDYAIVVKKGEATTVGAGLRLYFPVVTDPVAITIVPRIRYNTAVKGNRLSVSATGDTFVDPDDASPAKRGDWYFENPWSLRTEVQFDMFAGNDFIDVWFAPTLRYEVYGAPKMTKDDSTGTNKLYRKEAFYGIGYYLPIEVTLKISKNLTATIGMEAVSENMMSGKGGAFNPAAKIGGAVTWYF